MDRKGFLDYLKGRGLTEKTAERQMAIADHLDTMLSARHGPAGSGCAGVAARSLIDMLKESGQDTFENILAILRYGHFTKNDEVYQEAFIILDGLESMDTVYSRLEQIAGEEERDRIFGLIGPITPGTSAKDKAAAMRAIMAEIKVALDDSQKDELFESSFRNLGVAGDAEERNLYESLGSVDAYIEAKKQQFVEILQIHMEEGSLFFGQEITPEVIRMVEEDPEVAFGRRQGAEVYITKIPFRAKKWLEEEDPAKKRYYYCHCPWARESILSGEGTVDPIFCRCSAGFHKKSWEAIFDRQLECQVLESVLAGGSKCRFKLILPEEAML